MVNLERRLVVAENIGAIVDTLVDATYLRRIDRAWGSVSHHARDLIATSRPRQLDDSTRARAWNWLQAAAQRESPASDSRLERGPSAAAFDLALVAYPSFLAGRSDGLSVLLAGDGLEVWKRYYQSANPHYAPLNEAAALTLATHHTTRPSLRVLEVGAGTAGATVAAIAALSRAGNRPLTYLVTDIAVRLLRTAEAELSAFASTEILLEFERFNLDGRPGPRVAAGGFDAVLAVNALHNASDLSAAVRRLCALLADDGVLIISESLCGAGEQVHQEFFLNLLPMPDHRRERTSRFLSSGEWRAVLRKTGLDARIATNSLGPELVMLATVSSASAEG